VNRAAHPADEGHLTEWLLRAFALLLMGFVVARWGHAWLIDTSRWTALLLLLAEGYTLLLILLARRAIARDLSLAAMVATVYATCFAVLLDPQGTMRFAPEWVGAGFQLSGMAWQVSAKVVLGRSFGLLPAQRGLVTSGPYRVVRHPIYLGYLVSHVGFLLVNFSWLNLAVIATLYVAQVHRIAREEIVLAHCDEYRNYQSRVRWRLVPGLY
jgi:protein-S-isoprenylcysteine O-methyltransferase Ste14